MNPLFLTITSPGNGPLYSVDEERDPSNRRGTSVQVPGPARGGGGRRESVDSGVSSLGVSRVMFYRSCNGFGPRVRKDLPGVYWVETV